MTSELVTTVKKMLGRIPRQSPQQRLEEAIYSNLHTIDFEKLLLSSAKEGVTISERRLGDYALSPLKTRHNYNSGYDDYWSKTILDDHSNYQIYLDTPIGFTLLYRKLPNALVGVSCSDYTTVMIKQLQGVRGEFSYQSSKNLKGRKTSARGLMPLDWQKLLVDCIADLVREARFKKLGIQGYVHNHWTQIYDQFTLEQAEAKYDKVAERLGFTKEADNNWYKRL